MNQKITKNDIEILISTQNKTDFSFLENMFPFHQLLNLNILIINQTNKNYILSSNYSNIRVINSFEKGLSKSRNLALQNASKKIGIIADDDIIYHKNFEEIIIEAFIKYPKYAAIRFMAEHEKGKLLSSYPKKEKKKLNWFDILNTASVEMVVNTQLLKQNNLKFDENFGLNSTFGMGEEAVFLSDCKEKRLSLGFFSKIICKHPQEMTPSKISIQKTYEYMGVIFYRIFEKYYIFWIFIKIFFDIKQNKIKFFQIYKCFKTAIKGKKKIYDISSINNL